MFEDMRADDQIEDARTGTLFCVIDIQASGRTSSQSTIDTIRSMETYFACGNTGKERLRQNSGPTWRILTD